MVDSWAVDLANVGPIYPFVGTEWIWVILGVAFWIGWQGRYRQGVTGWPPRRLEGAGRHLTWGTGSIRCPYSLGARFLV
jgi:hypothetical protein